jgi:hypothetical protein
MNQAATLRSGIAWGITVFGWLLLTQSCVAQFVELTARIETISWFFKDAEGKPIETRHTNSVRCIVSTNQWYVENDWSQNAVITWWHIGNQIARRTVITKQLPQPKEPSGFFGGPSPVGERFLKVFYTEDGHPNGDVGIKLPWLAFCSGTYLKRPGREIPMPSSTSDREAFGYRDVTTVFADSFGLPNKVHLYSTNRFLKCEYQVQQSTNVLGWNFPTKFVMRHHRPTATGLSECHGEMTGTLTTIGPAPKPQIPEEMMKLLAK